MDKFLVVFTSIIILLIAYKVYVAINGKIRILTISLFFLLSFIAFAYIGSILLNICIIEPEYVRGFYQSPEYIFKIWTLLSISLVSILLGLIIARSTFSSLNVKKICRDVYFSNISLPHKARTSKIYLLIIVLLFFSFLLLIKYRNILGNLPIENIFSRNIDQHTLAIFRSDATNNFVGKLYRYHLIIKTLPLLLLIIVSFIKRNGIAKWGWLYYFLLVYNVFTSFMTLQKAPILQLVIILAIIQFFINTNVSIKNLVKIGLLTISLIIFMYVFFGRQQNISIILSTALHRIFIGSVAPMFWYVKYVEEFGFLNGLTFPNPAGIFPFEHVFLTVEIAEYAGLEKFGSEVVGSMPTVYVGELYVNFGTAGTIIGSLLVGYIIQSMDLIYLSLLAKRKYVLYLSFYIYYIYYFSQYSYTSISGLFVDFEFYLPLMLLLLIKSSFKK